MDDDFSLEKEIKTLREEFLKQVDADAPSPRLQYEFACMLACSPSSRDNREALELLDELVSIGYGLSDSLYQSALTHYKLGEFAAARGKIETLLRMEPRNLTALNLQSIILNRAAQDGVLMTTIFIGCAGMIAVMALSKWFQFGAFR
eukprot:GHVU01023383.1.p1 GENE.GHVU01023383.1~~GHVU01023383.1.p1  ORF type:complete len:147 (-),score=19.42 GHVU01023383.1:1556-1996(-)